MKLHIYIYIYRNKNSSAFLQKIPGHHHFPWLSMTLAVFHDFPGLENGLTKFHDFSGRVVTLFDGVGWATATASWFVQKGSLSPLLAQERPVPLITMIPFQNNWGRKPPLHRQKIYPCYTPNQGGSQKRVSQIIIILFLIIFHSSCFKYRQYTL